MSALLRTTREYAPPLTVDEFERLPDGEGKQELHDGRVVEMAPVGGWHGALATALLVRLDAHVRARGGPRYGRVVPETGYVLWPERPRESRAPDVSFVAAAHAPRPWPRRLVRGRPDLAVEVLSPDDRPAALRAKVREYLGAGVPLVWVVNPDRRTATVYRPDRAPRRVAGALEGEEVLPGFRLPLAELWAELDEPEEAPGEAGEDGARRATE
jgi:Uma2 family endonuclease